nr:RNA-directed DNA polymerase, eukaryota [Tanacetum cinerariifolium]
MAQCHPILNDEWHVEAVWYGTIGYKNSPMACMWLALPTSLKTSGRCIIVSPCVSFALVFALGRDPYALCFIELSCSFSFLSYLHAWLIWSLGSFGVLRGLPLCSCPFALCFLDLSRSYSDSLGNSGGILCIWEATVFKKDYVTISDNFVAIYGTWIPSNVKILIVAIYAPQQPADKRDLWEYLSILIGRWKGESILMGDFNEVRSREERRGSVFNPSGARIFNHFIDSLGLVDFKFDGYSFTWSHPSATKMSKLDRFLVSDGVISLFPYISAICLDRHLLDHRPILLRDVQVDFGPTPFRFYHSWFCYEGFDEMVEQSWRAFSHSDRNAMIHKELESGTVSDTCLARRCALIGQLHDIKKKEAADSFQKSKVRWAIEGDENSSFFHGIINNKRSQLAIRGVFVDGVWQTDPMMVKEAFHNHFSSRFKMPMFPGIKINFPFPNRLSLEHATDIERDVSRDEIREAVWNCGDNKSPGPDGYTFEFFKKYWGFIGLDFCEAVDYFFAKGAFSKGCNSSFIALFPKVMDAKLVNDFRPISLIGCVYKVMTKILANRLALIISNIVSSTQSAFISERQILDGPFIINELLHWCKRKHEKAMLFKVDFAKAYDSIRWDYLIEVLGAFGFGSKWCQWIRGVSRSAIEAAASTIGCSIMDKQFRYLGIMVDGNTSRHKAWEESTVAAKIAQVDGSFRIPMRGGLEQYQFNKLILFIDSVSLSSSQDRAMEALMTRIANGEVANREVANREVANGGANLNALKKTNKWQVGRNKSKLGSNGNLTSTTTKPLLALTLLKVRMLDQTPRKKLSQKEYKEKRSKNLCFYYDKKYVPGHKCEDQLFTLVVLADQEEQEEEFVDADENLDEMKTEEVQPQISLNALNTKMPKRLGCAIRPTFPLIINVVGEKQLLSVSELVIYLGDIKSNFKELKIEFVYNNKKMVLKGTHKTRVQWAEREQRNDKVLEPELTQVVENFSNVFEVPHELPPKRNHDHRILLILGVIKPSQSPFSSPIVMVKKKDNTWRMCVDYRRLNKSTIKDKFPIPIIDELIDELHGFVVFSKLDLRSGFHQIRIFEDDIAKIAFRTHKGHYEFLVMPFGLTNAPFTFQALMNNVFNDYLRKFFLVFFDDIHIYSKSISEHVEYLATILTTMRQNKLFAKKTKCVFGTSQVKYLGYVISTQGVATDPRAFKWSGKAQNSFETLKVAMTHASVLALPDFTKSFVVETDASGVDHYNLKYLLDQIITTPTQMKWLPMLMRYDYEVTYKKGVDNAAADALSRVQNEGKLMASMVVTVPTALFTKITASWTSDISIQTLLQSLQDGKMAKKHYTWNSGQLLRKNKLVIGKDEELRKELMAYFHDRDKVFLSNFWKELFKLLQAKLLMSIAYHPQTDGQIEVVLRMLPKAVYGQPPLVHVPYLGGLSKMDAVDRTLEAREQAIQMLKFHLSRSQNRMQQQADKRRSDREGLLEPEPIALLDRKMVKKHNAVVVYRLVQWSGGTKEDSTWEPLKELKKEDVHKTTVIDDTRLQRTLKRVGVN